MLGMGCMPKIATTTLPLPRSVVQNIYHEQQLKYRGILRANMAPIRQSRPDSGLSFQVHAL